MDASGKPVEPVSRTNEYLAKGLRCCPRAVARGIKRLVELRLITVHKRKQRTFVVGIRPLALTLAKKSLGFHTLLDVIGTDASLVRGSHGRLPATRDEGPVLLCTDQRLARDRSRCTTCGICFWISGDSRRGANVCCHRHLTSPRRGHAHHPVQRQSKRAGPLYPHVPRPADL